MSGLEAQDTRLILRFLTRLAHESSAPPLITIHNSTGSVHSGTLLDFKEHPTGYLVLLEGNKKTSPSLGKDLSYLDLREPIQITIHDAESLSKILLFGKITRWSSDEPLASLQAKKITEEIRKTFSELGIELSYSDELFSGTRLENNISRDLLLAARDYFSKNLQDTVSASSLVNAKILRFNYTPKKSPTIALQGSELTVSFDPTQTFATEADFLSALDRCF